MLRKYAVVLGVVVAMTACAPMSRVPTVDSGATQIEREKQLDMAFKESLRRHDRLHAVGWKVLTANADACGDKVLYRYGLWVEDGGKQNEDFKGAWRRAFSSLGKPVVTVSPPGTPFQQAGLVAGDMIVAVNGTPVDSMAAFSAVLNAIPKDKQLPLKLEYSRAGVSRTVELASTRSCDYPLQLTGSDVVNAYADGSNVIITQGMLRFAASDEELALVIGHELGHNTQEHMKAQMGNRLIGGLLGALASVALRTNVTQSAMNAGGAAFSKEFEAEADYVGTYYAAKAGFNVDHAADFWRRMAVEQPAAINHGTSHPDTASRFVSIEATVKEIAEKRAAGRPLVPERK